MEHLYNKIKPVGKRVIILAEKEQKNKHQFTKEDGTIGELYVDNQFSWDSRITNTTQGILLTDFKNLKAGTYVLVHHNSMVDECELVHDDIPHTHRLYAVDEHFVYFGVKDGEIIPTDGFMLVERLYEPEDVSSGGIILTIEPVKIHNKLRVLATSKSNTEFKKGDVVITYKFSDYEMTHNVNGKMEKIIRLRQSDCLAIDHDFDKRGY